MVNGFKKCFEYLHVYNGMLMTSTSQDNVLNWSQFSVYSYLMFTQYKFTHSLRWKSTISNNTFVKLQKQQTEWRTLKNCPSKPPKEVKGNNTIGVFKKKMNCLSYSLR